MTVAIIRAHTAALVVAAVALLSCGDDGGGGIVEPTFCQGIPAALFDNVPSLPLAQLRPALRDANSRLIPALPDVTARSQLVASMDRLAIATTRDEATCTEFSVAAAALGAIEADAQGRSPEASSVRVVLELLGGSLRGP
ncbi:MAG: hypothetical protein ABFS34_08850 [Gemmatimonadota bacterium]